MKKIPATNTTDFCISPSKVFKLIKLNCLMNLSISTATMQAPGRYNLVDIITLVLRKVIKMIYK